jgi:putative redox protein
MISANAVWVDNARFVGIAGSRHSVVMDAASSEKSASSPMELVLIALCGCTATDVASILQKKREPFTALEVRAEADQPPEPPRIYTHIRLIYKVRGNVTKKAMEDAVRLSKDKYCSVSAMLKKTATMTFKIEYE